MRRSDPDDPPICKGCEAEGDEDVASWFRRLLWIGIALAVVAWSGRSSFALMAITAGFWMQVMVVPHELAHAVVARLCGWQATGVDIGNGRVRARWQVFGLAWRFRSPAGNGTTSVRPRTMAGLGIRDWLITAAGPAVHLAALTPLLFSSVRESILEWDVPGILWTGFLLGNLVDLVINLWPVDDHDGVIVWRGPFLTQDEVVTRFRRYNLGHAYEAVDRGDTAFAREVLADFLAADGVPSKNRASGYALLAWCELMDDAPDRVAAREHVDTAMRARADLYWVEGVEACVAVEEGDTSARKRIEKVLEDEDDYEDRARLLAYLALAVHRAGKDGKAAKHLKRARRLDPRCPLLPRIEAELSGEVATPDVAPAVRT